MKKKVLFYLQILVCLVIYVIFTSITGIGCPIRRAIHMPCPACGITRGLIEILKLNFDKAFEYHPLVLFLPIYVLIMIHSGTEFMKKIPRWLFYSFTVIGAIIIFAVYVYRIMNGFGPV